MHSFNDKEDFATAIPPTLQSAEPRRGKWGIEEEAYTSRVISDFHKGLLDLPSGVTLRQYLSLQLNCDPMRITKKFARVQNIGKCSFVPLERTIDSASHILKAQDELRRLQRAWYSKLFSQDREFLRKGLRVKIDCDMQYSTTGEEITNLNDLTKGEKKIQSVLSDFLSEDDLLVLISWLRCSNNVLKFSSSYQELDFQAKRGEKIVERIKAQIVEYYTQDNADEDDGDYEKEDCDTSKENSSDDAATANNKPNNRDGSITKTNKQLLIQYARVAAQSMASTIASNNNNNNNNNNNSNHSDQSNYIGSSSIKPSMMSTNHKDNIMHPAHLSYPTNKVPMMWSELLPHHHAHHPHHSIPATLPSTVLVSSSTGPTSIPNYTNSMTTPTIVPMAYMCPGGGGDHPTPMNLQGEVVSSHPMTSDYSTDSSGAPRYYPSHGLYIMPDSTVVAIPQMRNGQPQPHIQRYANNGHGHGHSNGHNPYFQYPPNGRHPHPPPQQYMNPMIPTTMATTNAYPYHYPYYPQHLQQQVPLPPPQPHPMNIKYIQQQQQQHHHSHQQTTSSIHPNNANSNNPLTTSTTTPTNNSTIVTTHPTTTPSSSITGLKRPMEYLEDDITTSTSTSSSYYEQQSTGSSPYFDHHPSHPHTTTTATSYFDHPSPFPEQRPHPYHIESSEYNNYHPTKMYRDENYHNGNSNNNNNSSSHSGRLFHPAATAAASSHWRPEAGGDHPHHLSYGTTPTMSHTASFYLPSSSTSSSSRHGHSHGYPSQLSVLNPKDIPTKTKTSSKNHSHSNSSANSTTNSSSPDSSDSDVFQAVLGLQGLREGKKFVETTNSSSSFPMTTAN